MELENGRGGVSGKGKERREPGSRGGRTVWRRTSATPPQESSEEASITGIQIGSSGPSTRRVGSIFSPTQRRLPAVSRSRFFNLSPSRSLAISAIPQLSRSVKRSPLSGFPDAAEQGVILFLLRAVILFLKHLFLSRLPDFSLTHSSSPLLSSPVLLSSFLLLHADFLPRCLTVSCDDTAVASDPSPHFRHVLGSSASETCVV